MCTALLESHDYPDFPARRTLPTVEPVPDRVGSRRTREKHDDCCCPRNSSRSPYFPAIHAECRRTSYWLRGFENLAQKVPEPREPRREPSKKALVLER